MVEGSEFQNYFSEVMKKANKPGMDFYEFYNILKSNDSLPVDEPTKYRVSYVAFKEAGISATTLILSANDYLQKFSEEAADFQATHKDKQTAEVDNKDKKVEDLKAENTRLQAQIGTNLATIARLQSESAQSRITLATRKESFNVAYENAINQVNNIVRNIKMYLNGTT